MASGGHYSIKFTLWWPTLLLREEYFNSNSHLLRAWTGQAEELAALFAMYPHLS